MAALRTHVATTETGESPFAVRIEVGGHVFTGDEPVGTGGGLGPSPFELLAAALAECTSMTVRWFARSQGWPLEQVEVAVDHVKKVVAGNLAPIDVFDKRVWLHGSKLTEEQRVHLLAIAGKCPIQRVLEGTPVITTRDGATS